jgi:hypothetical protein
VQQREVKEKDERSSRLQPGKVHQTKTPPPRVTSTAKNLLRLVRLVILIIVLVLVFGLGGGYYGYGRWGTGGGAGIGLGTVLVILLVCYLLGLFR